MPQFKVDHVHLRSNNVENMAHFFETMFGASLQKRVQTTSMHRLVLTLGGLTLFIDQTSSEITHRAAPPYLGLEHIGLTVNGFDSAIENLKSKGAQFSTEPHSPRTGLKLCYLRGPEGVIVEVLERSFPG
jgi:lactoylglutathione lyase